MNKLLVVIPAYNEAGTIGDIVNGVGMTLPDADVMVINDGSADTTSEIARDAGAMVLDLPYNMGIGGAVQAGFFFAKSRHYDTVVRLDGDGQHRVSDIKNLLAPILEGEADMVVGSRFLSQTGFKSTLVRRMGIRFFSTIVTLLVGKRFTDPTSGFQAANSKAINFFVQEYPPEYPEIEALILANKAGLNVKEVPTVMLERTNGVSSINFFRSIYLVLEVLIAIIVSVFRKH